MTTRADFSAEEWKAITEAVALTGYIMIGLERGGTVRESLAMAKVYEEAQKASGSGDLIGDVVRSGPDISDRDFAGQEEMRSAGLRRLTEAAGIVETKAASDELAGYRDLVMKMARRIAEARKGVSDAERAMQAQIANAVGAEPPLE